MSSGKAIKESLESKPSFEEMANVIRALSMDAVEKAKSGHPGMPMGMADVATVLFSEFLKFYPKDPAWPDRDRFILSAGHGSMLLYSLLYLTGYKDITLDEIKNFRQLNSKTAGHPEYGHAAGIETTTGPLGQGLANSVGMAIAEKIMEARFGKDLVDHYTYVIAGDGCLMEGISHEAISLAGHLKLNKLIVLFDDNNISIDGPTSLSVSDNQLERFKASNWFVQEIDGHDPEAIRTAIRTAKGMKLPSLIACKTTIAKGAPTKAGTASSHGSPLGEQEIAGARKNLGWQHAPFVVPENILQEWREIGSRGEKAYKDWQSRLKSSDKSKEFERVHKEKLPENFAQKISEFKKQLVDKKPKEATRQSSGNVLEVLTSFIPELVGGSADLTGSNNTKTASTKPINKDNFAGNYIYYGVREHAMAAAMNGMALHKGIIPYGGTFLVFADYCRPSIRLASLMQQKVVFVMTHDSIGLGEDGPTHQPVEHLSSLRSIPNLLTFRPCDALETAEAWEIALQYNGPSLLALTRQALPFARQSDTKENFSEKGAYIISPASGKAAVTIIATGSEVSIALEAQAKLKEKNIPADVISMPCTNLFDKQNSKYKKQVILEDTVKVAIEAGSSFGWERYIGSDGIFVGMQGFGASAPYQDLYKHFGITADSVVKQVSDRLENVLLWKK